MQRAPVRSFRLRRHERQKRVAPDLNRDIRACEEEPVRAEGLRNRDRHEQAPEHQPDQEQPNGDRIGIELVRDPGGVVPRPPDDEQREQRLPCAAPTEIVEEQVGDLRDREDEHEIEEQLECCCPLPLAGVSRALESAHAAEASH